MCCALCCAGVQVPKDLNGQLQQTVAFVNDLKTMPIAVNTSEANEQHYEVCVCLVRVCVLVC